MDLLLMLPAAVLLCASFIFLVQGGGYTANRNWVRQLNESRQRIALKQAAKSQEPVSVTELAIIREWHTPITRFHRVERRERTVR